MTVTKRAVVLSSIAMLFFVFGAPYSARAASYNLTADKETFSVGNTFTVDVKIDSTDVGVNAAQATITFPKDTVQVTSLDKSTSAFDFWLQGPSFSNDAGQVTFIGGSQSGISGKALEVLRIAFKVKGTGAVSIIFSDGAVTASDGSGTNVLTAMNGLQLTSSASQTAAVIAPSQITRTAVTATGLPTKPVLTVPLYPDSSAWYADVTKFIVQWDLPREVTDVATAVNQQPTFDPTASEGLFNNKTFSPLTDGIWYLHVRFKDSVGWGPTVHYRIGIDSAPPLSFTVTSPDGLTTANVAPTIAFGTNDQPSGILDYKIMLDGTLSTTTMLAKYTLPPQQAGKHSLVVQAVDRAGNTAESRVILDISEIPLITIAGVGITRTSFFISLILALLAGGAFGWYIGKKEREQRRRRIVVAQRDIQTAFGIIKKEVDSLLVKYNGDAITDLEARDMKSALKKIAETIEKNKQYVVQNIEEIES
ncbi:MAG: cohesin domain-containing protein [Candidatus Pacebacteria bacterium]|nr:cohesin domain-containing protein [Candidatus Paceibacterota bacterium]